MDLRNKKEFSPFGGNKIAVESDPKLQVCITPELRVVATIGGSSFVQGVRFNVVFCSMRLKSTILSQNWQDNKAHLDESIPPFVILSQTFEKYN